MGISYFVTLCENETPSVHSNQYFYMKRTEYMVLNTKMYIACDTKGIFFIVVGWPEGPLSRVKK